MTSDIERYMSLQYGVTLAPEETTDGEIAWVAMHPELEGCMAHGSSEAEAVANLEEARRLYIASMLEDGLTPPVPVAGLAPMRAVLHFFSSREGVPPPRPPSGIFQPV